MDRKQKHPAVMFSMLDGKDYASIIWKQLKPEGGVTFRCTNGRRLAGLLTLDVNPVLLSWRLAAGVTDERNLRRTCWLRWDGDRGGEEAAARVVDRSSRRD